jgi:alpha-beta hydrolase superfamily lysophospholipase
MDVLEAHGDCKTVVLVANGLNLRARALSALYEPLRDRGAAIVVVRLRGHAGDSTADAATIEELLSIDATHWIEDWREAAGVADDYAAARHLPLTFLGYSLGALVHVAGLATGQFDRNPFCRQVLLAPAVRVRPRSRLILAFRLLGRRFVLPSFVRRDVRSHFGTSVGAYDALLRLEAGLDILQDPSRVSIPTLVLMESRDELVSRRRLVDWIQRNGLQVQWHIEEIAKEWATARTWFRHDIIDADGLGKEGYEALTRRISAALIDGVMA